MGSINLEDVKVSFEGQTLPAIQLIGKLQTQLQEATCRIAVLASALADLQTALLNANTVEVKLTLTREDYDRFKSLGGTDDGERIRNAVMALIHPEDAGAAPGRADSRPPAVSGGSGPVTPPTDPLTGFAQIRESVPATPAARFVEPILGAAPIADEPSVRSKQTTTCPRCQAPMDLPETSNNQWSVEIKCGNCGVKYLVKSKPDDPATGPI